MGKKSAKGKEKKLKRKEEILKLNEATLAVKNANQVGNPLELLPAFTKYERNGLTVKLHCKNISEMSEDEVNIAFQLVESNMKGLYERSSWGWNEKGKREEMAEENARYLFALDGEDNVIAVAHFRFDVDDEVEVLYCYEIQLTDATRGKGLGKFMMQILELMALKTKMKKVVLTVFKENKRGINFFEKLKYTIDETSPQYDDPLHPENYDYEIYSKQLQTK
ncbi:N-alpha-acetyltransferase 40-like [Hydractinia symbiolongicarpus]|uniref:N-alpha-acetyltransferase 40-like n=1 Tax=Hydractinia symbiolongicarpus TaxID=13093 RepID=UPI00254DB6CF|nr:N-alpha-acetyltransferase 40-like [Hydractinia symbiolongicarpus]